MTVWRAELEPILSQLQLDSQFSLMMGGVRARLATMRSKMAVEDEFSAIEFDEF
ncbi:MULTISPECIES: hypothetical protein [unclassified Pseudoalteromonas]|uniref:hypothetical protein n=1 Tax=unclassified Pseudoalteromonas TaxID=194690 RepID=UPI000AC940A8|nr:MULTISPECIES: hypothetical protein [unclassified Pseudoalteromonas]